jgi:type IV secretory pathway VirB4 component
LNNNQNNNKNIKPAPAQQYLPIGDIREGIVILKDGSLRIVMLTTSINFDLKSQKEQNAIIYAYQGFLNSLSFPIQIVMQSRKLDLTGYLANLKNRIPETESELLRIQTQDYINFIERLLNVANIMNKRFYIVIPFFPPVLKKEGFWQKFNNKVKTSETVLDITNFEKYKRELEQRAGVVASGLAGIGLRAAQLSTKELIELYYQTYNPDLSTKKLNQDGLI